MKHTERETWLLEAVKQMTPLFEAKGYKIPSLRVSCGWPHKGGTRNGKRTLGQCWATEAATDGVAQIFISPYLDKLLDPYGVLAVLVHEVCHAVVGTDQAHNKVFGKCARSVGLEGKLTSTIPSADLLTTFEGWVKQLGEYPHAKLDLTKSPVKKQSTRMLKAECHCGYTCRLAKKWIDDVGAPHCPQHGEMAVDGVEKSEDGGEDE